MTIALADIGADATLLTVNKRLAGELRARYDAVQAGRGQQVWASADIIPWEAWLARLYEVLIDAGRAQHDLLDTLQERLLWQSVIERDPAGSGLLRPAAAAQAAQRSAQLISDWQLERHPLAALGGAQTRKLLDWRAAVTDELEQRGQLARAQLLPYLAAGFRDGHLSAPKTLVLAGFDDLSPAQQGLLDAVAASGCVITTLTEPALTAACSRVRTSDGESEIRLAALWADDQVRNHGAQRIAVVDPQIAQRRADIARIFAATLAPADYLQHSAPNARFNLSLGEPLAAHALVDTALLVLELLRGDHPLGRFGQLLRSPFVGGHGDEWAARALLDAALRDDGLPLIDLRRLRFRLGQYEDADPRHCPRLGAAIDAALARLAELPRRASPAAWAGHLLHLLHDIGWPGDAALDSVEYQQHERFRRLFSELAALAKVRPSLTLGDAVQLLRTLAQETLFQAESPATPIQVLGPLEAAGMQFDAIWLLGMHDQAWPPAPQPDPLLPTALQRELGMPHASAERELQFAGALTERLVHACRTLVASHPAVDGDRELRPSPLIADWPSADPSASVAPATTAALRACGDPGPLQAYADAALPAPSSPLGGGASLLAAQAACPFRAVALYRLGAAPLAEPTHAPDAALTGSLVHELLQRTWQALGDSAGLARHDRDGLATLLLPLAQATLDDIGRRRPDLFTARFRELETQRLVALVGDWLEIERTRAAAFRVVALERKQAIRLGELELTTRVDRIDELADGSLAVIDYKTGRTVSHAGWFDERLSEPQLPLYCLQSDAPVGAALLARVRSDATGCRFVGLSRAPGFADGVDTAGDDDTADWPDTLEHWQRALATLAGEVVAGRADPTPSPQACQYCPLGALCRVAERSAEGADDS